MTSRVARPSAPSPPRAGIQSSPVTVPTGPVARRARSGRGSDGAPPPRPRRRTGLRIPARLRITGWLVLLLTFALLSVTILTRNLLLENLEDEVTAGLQQEVEEFSQFAREGRNPETGQPFASAGDLLAVHIERQRANEAEVLAGVTPGGAPLSIGQPGAVRATTEPGVLDAITSRPAQSGSTMTSAGELRWANVPIEVGGSPPGVDGFFVVAHLVTGERADVDSSIRILALVSLLGLVLAAAASWLVAGQILEPVRLVRRAVTEIGEQDDLALRVPVHGNDDIATLSEQFNAMLDRLEAAFGSQRAFLDDASHELRTPITIIRGNLEMIGDDPVEREEEVRLCIDELDRMSRIVEELLLLARAERPDFIRPVPVELAELTSDVDAKVRALAPRRWWLAEIGDGTVHVDPQRITQAVIQLAQNAVQHTEPGDTITLGSALRNGYVSFWVADQGPGIRAEDQEMIFRRFARGSTDGDRGGAGLGLTIVTAIAEGHRGIVTLDSTFGSGSRFGIELPVNGAPRP